MIWTDRAVEHLRSFWGKNTTKEIADSLGTTKNAVIQHALSVTTQHALSMNREHELKYNSQHALPVTTEHVFL